MVAKKFQLDQCFQLSKCEKKSGKYFYRGRLWTPDIPTKSTRKNKKLMVMATKTIQGKKYGRIIHFGQRGYGHNYSQKAKMSYLKRSEGIRNKQGQLTKNDKWSANYWSRKILWPKNKVCSGPKITQRAA